MDTVGGRQIGRMRIELPGAFEENVVPVGFLREQGLQVEVVETAETVAGVPATADLPDATEPSAALTEEGAK